MWVCLLNYKPVRERDREGGGEREGGKDREAERRRGRERRHNSDVDQKETAV